MRNKAFRIKHQRKYKRRARNIALSMLSESEFNENKLMGSYNWFNTYEEVIEHYTHCREKNRKNCGCTMCRNQRKNKFLPKKERRTLIENKFHEKADQEIQEFWEQAS